MRALHALLVVALVAASVVGVACSAARSSTASAPSAGTTASAPAAPHGNAARADDVGSARCAPCHAKEHDAWLASPMHRMTRDPRAADVRAPFDGRSLHFKGDTATLETHGQERYVRLASGGAPAGLYRVTRVIGGRTREDFAGVLVAGEGDQRALGIGDEVVLPVSYLLFSGELRYKGYSVLLHERSSLRAGPPWAPSCLFCHNTVRFGATREHYTAEDLTEVGIGCEACHGGGREHLDDPAKAPSFVAYGPEAAAAARSPSPSPSPASPATDPARRDPRAEAINAVCARCHQVLFSRYPWTWEGERRQSARRGGSPINSGEARDFLLGGCARSMACTACHDPHDARDRAARERALGTPAGNAVCTRCHGELDGDGPLRAHAHHDPSGPGGACVACHMPRKNLGLDLRLTRYHRIGSPTDPERVVLDRPLECALCHADKSVEALLSTMERWWNKAYPRDLLARLYGDLSRRTLIATLERGKPHEKAVAAAALGEARDRDAAPRIARELVNEYPLVRMFAARGLAGALGRECAVDPLNQPVERIQADVQRCLGEARAPAAVFEPPARRGGDDEVPED